MFSPRLSPSWLAVVTLLLLLLTLSVCRTTVLANNGEFVVLRFLVRSQTPQQASDEPSTPLTPAQMKEVDESFALFDYSETGTLNLHEVKVIRGTIDWRVHHT